MLSAKKILGEISWATKKYMGPILALPLPLALLIRSQGIMFGSVYGDYLIRALIIILALLTFVYCTIFWKSTRAIRRYQEVWFLKSLIIAMHSILLFVAALNISSNLYIYIIITPIVFFALFFSELHARFCYIMRICRKKTVRVICEKALRDIFFYMLAFAIPLILLYFLAEI